MMKETREEALLSPEDEARATRFLQAYNGIDRALKEALAATEHVPFRTLIEEYHRRHPSWQSKEDLIEYSRLRNVVVHNRIFPYRYYSIPTAATVEAIEAIYQRLTKPVLALPLWKREVQTVQANDSLASVLARINNLQYTRFPVYDGRNFVGLLTENGITRWIARHSATRLTTIDFEEHTAREMLSHDKHRANCEFLSGTATVEEVRYRFVGGPRLEAVLLTKTGNSQEKLQGIVTRGDVLNAGRVPA
jgi:predicted transcriptional regulator